MRARTTREWATALGRTAQSAARRPRPPPHPAATAAARSCYCQTLCSLYYTYLLQDRNFHSLICINPKKTSRNITAPPSVSDRAGTHDPKIAATSPVDACVRTIVYVCSLTLLFHWCLRHHHRVPWNIPERRLRHLVLYLSVGGPGAKIFRWCNHL